MKNYLVGFFCFVALAGLISCQQTVVQSLSYSDSPAISGSVWSGTNTTTINKLVPSGSTVTETAVSLSSAKTVLTFNANKTFSLVGTTTYDATNANTNFIPDNWNYSLSPAGYDPPTIATTGTNFLDSNGNQAAWINGQFYTSTYYIEYASIPLYTIGSTSTTYNGQTVYPVTWATSTLGPINGKVETTTTGSGSWVTANQTSNPVNTTQYIMVTVTSIVTVANYPTQETTTQTPAANSVSYLLPEPIVSPTGASTYCISSQSYEYFTIPNLYKQ
jgi:hypothetical protein